jgi:hypothetical protein
VPGLGARARQMQGADREAVMKDADTRHLVRRCATCGEPMALPMILLRELVDAWPEGAVSAMLACSRCGEQLEMRRGEARRGLKALLAGQGRVS